MTDATFYCWHCGEDRPIEGRVDVHEGHAEPHYWCRDCWETSEPPEDPDAWSGGIAANE